MGDAPANTHGSKAEYHIVWAGEGSALVGGFAYHARAMINHLVCVCAVLFGSLVGCTSEAAELPGKGGTPASPPAAAQPVAVNLDVTGAAELLKNEPDLVILDVRTADEYDAGHITDAVLLDIRSEDFAARLADLDRGDTYLVHCESGGRSSSAFGQMKELGFVSVYHLDGGMQAWRQAEQPVVK